MALVSQIHRSGWGLVVLGFLHLILENRCVVKLVQRLKSQSLHSSGDAINSIRLVFAVFIQPSDLCILLYQVIISYILFLPHSHLSWENTGKSLRQ